MDLRPWLRRYLVPEGVGTAAALAAAWAVHAATGSPYLAALGGSLAEGIGYYGTVVGRDALRRHRATGAGAIRSVVGVMPGTVVEFGAAEILDTLLLRPALMFAGPLLTGSVLAGTLVGKLAADVAFYALVAPGRRLRRRLFPEPPTTPYLSVDLAAVERSYDRFREALPEARVHYAMKCNPDPGVLRRLHAAGCSFEIASGPELTDLAAVGVEPAAVLFSNPVKAPEHIRAAHRAGVWRYAVDSDAELDKIARWAPGAAVYVRLRTDAAGSAVPSEGKFGVYAAPAVALLRRARDLGLRPYGITFHVGSQTVNPTPWAAAIEVSGAVMATLLGDGIRLAMLDLGGGFPARYDADPPDLDDYAKHIRAAVQRHVPYPVELVVEPGRALVAEAGVMVATVIGVAERAGRAWAHLDVGAFNGLMEALESGNRLRYPVTDGRGSALRRPYHLTGPTCDSQDTILYDVELSADLAVGDTVRLHVAGAYTCAYASRFNGFAVPAVRHA